MADLIERYAVLKTFAEMLDTPDYDVIARYYSEADVQKAIQAFKDIPAANPWIPCSERMPLGGRVLATTKQGYVVDVIFVVNGSQWFRNGEYFPTDTVIAWMPMPDAYEPPEKE